ncbi:MAG: transposase, partial [Rhodospirillaceae bacterium]|nr:transposase [Rhodospirillaceae bacterium]
ARKGRNGGNRGPVERDHPDHQARYPARPFTSAERAACHPGRQAPRHSGELRSPRFLGRCRRQPRIVINQWLRQYNHIHPHQALNMRPPVPETLVRNGTEPGG